MKYKLLPDNKSYKHRFRGDLYDLLYLNGFPPVYYTTKPWKPPRLETLWYEVSAKQKKAVTVSAAKQLAFINAFLTAQVFDPMVIAVGGYPTEKIALSTLTAMVIERSRRFGLLDASGIYCINSVHTCKDLMEVIQTPRVLIIHNIHPKLSVERAINIRDILTSYPSTTRIVVALHKTNPTRFVETSFYTRVKMTLNLCG